MPWHGVAQWSVPSQWPEQQAPGAAGQLPASAVQPGAGAQAAGVPVQMPVQHSGLPPQLVPFGWHGLAQWLVASHELEQQSPPATQEAPLTAHGVAQTLVASQRPEQQVPGAAGQVFPFATHGVAHLLVASQ